MEVEGKARGINVSYKHGIQTEKALMREWKGCRRDLACIGSVEGGMGGLSLWAHMLGSLISVQLCPSNATDQHTSCQQTHSSFAEIEMRCFLMDKSSFTVSTCPLSRWNEARLCTPKLLTLSADGGLGWVQSKDMAQSIWPQSGGRQNKDDHIRKEQNKWDGCVRCWWDWILPTDCPNCQMTFSKLLRRNKAKKQHISEDGLSTCSLKKSQIRTINMESRLSW